MEDSKWRTVREYLERRSTGHGERWWGDPEPWKNDVFTVEGDSVRGSTGRYFVYRPFLGPTEILAPCSFMGGIILHAERVRGKGARG